MSSKNGTNYKVEILTASRTGLKTFLLQVQRVRKAGTLAGRAVGRGPMTTIPTIGYVPMRQADENGEGYLAQGGGKWSVVIASLVGSLNRRVNLSRIQDYWGAMIRKGWWFTPDPIVVTDDGSIINGQHRLLAVAKLIEEAEEGETIPMIQFVVVWGVDKKAAILMDEARRSSTDRRDIALRFAAASAK